MTEPRKETAIETAPRPDHRRNMLAFVGDYLFFGAGMSFASQATVLPSLVRSLTAGKTDQTERNHQL